jgi:hypothetical protein
MVKAWNAVAVSKDRRASGADEVRLGEEPEQGGGRCGALLEGERSRRQREGDCVEESKGGFSRNWMLREPL